MSSEKILLLNKNCQRRHGFLPGKIGVRHFQIVLMFFGMMIAYGLRVYLSVAVVAMVKPANSVSKIYKWSTDEVSLIHSSFFWGYIVTQIPFGYLASIWSAQKLLSGGIFVCGLLSILIPLVVDQGGWIAVCACRVGMGLSQGCVLPGVQTLLAKWVPPSERARLGTFAYAGAQLGTVVAMPISGQLAASTFGWPSIFYFFGAVGIGWSIAFFIFGYDEPANHSYISDAEKRYIEYSLGQNKEEKPPIPWLKIFTSPPMWALIIVHCGQNWGFWLLLTEIPTYLSDVIKSDIKENGWLSALPYLAMWLLSFPASWMSDYALRRGVSRGIIRKVSNTVAHWGPGLALLALCFVDVENKAVPVTLLVIAVGLNAGSLCGFQINHIDLSPNFAGTMMSITNCVASTIAIIAPIICGHIVGTEKGNVEQWHIVFYISALIYFLGNLIFIIFGSGEIQLWNYPLPSAQQERARSYQITTISRVYDPSTLTLKNHKSIETT